MNISTRFPKREEILKFLNFKKIHLIILTFLVSSLIAISFNSRNINVLASTVIDFIPTADFGISSNSSRYPSGYLGFFDVLDDDSDGTYAKSNSTSATSGSFGVSYNCPLACPSGVVTSVNVKIRNARTANAGTNARFAVELRRNNGFLLGSVTGILFSGTAPTIGTYQAIIAVDPNLNVNPNELSTVISWSKASASGSEVRFQRARLDVTTTEPNVGGDTTVPTVSITSPQNGSVFTTEGDIIVESQANDNIAIERVEFLKDNVLQATDFQTTNPHIFNWHITSADNGAHALIVRAFDTASPQQSSEASINVSVNIDATVASTPTPTPTSPSTPTPAPAGSKIPLIDMGTQTYLGFSGGLYPNASNTMPIEHSNQGLLVGSRVVPLDTNGIPSATGKLVLLSVGMSNTRNEWCKYSDSSSTCSAESFMTKASLDAMVDKQNLLIVNGAKGGEVASSWTSPNSDNYTRIANTLTSLGASEKQVQVIWLKQANKNPTKSLPASDADAYTLETHLGNIIRTLKVRYPNLQQVFISSRIYAGYATTTLNPEPYAYEYGFSVKWLIEAQINQMKTGTIDSRAGNLNYNSGIAPWIAWAPYIWADDNNPRSDGLVWLKSDFKSDGVHPYKTGVPKVSNALLNFFKTNPATGTWFLADGL